MHRVHVVPHTHWDREWYLSFQLYRIRLTRLMEKLFDILERDDDYVSFHLDGQSVVIEDYLEIHPEHEDRLRRYITSGRIHVGPWYVQPDEALVSGEAMIRNFRLGIEVAERMGRSLRIGYLPDMFGHISQMPQILNGFGMRQAIFWRGLGDVAANTKAELIWEGADGSEVFAHRFPNRNGYCGIFRLYADPAKAAEQIRECLQEHHLPIATTDTLLLMVGVDHMEPQTDFTAVLREISALLPDYELIHSSLDRFLHGVQASALRSPVSLGKAVGELRDTNRTSSGSINFLLANVLSSRVVLKQRNWEAQHLLERWAEPFSSVVSALTGKYPSGLIGQSWKYLLHNHPHDSIGGCSRDEVHRQMMTRFEWSTDISGQLKDEALHTLAAHIDTSGLPEDRIIVHVMNPTEWEREDTVTAEMYISVQSPAFRTIDIYDSEGYVLPAQVVDVEDVYRSVNHEDPAVRDLALLHDTAIPEQKGILVGLEIARKVTVRFSPGAIPPFGYATFTALPVRKRLPQSGTLIMGQTLENDYLRADIRADGSIDLLDKETGRRFESLLVYEDGGDIGDGYTYSAPLLDERFSTKGLPAAISIVEDGPAQATVRIEHRWALPQNIASDRKRRSADKRECRLVTDVSLGLHNRWLGIKTHFDNVVRDHRLRVTLPTGLLSNKSWAAAAFDTVERSVEVRQPDPYVWIEDAVGAYPQHGFAGVTDEIAGVGFAVAPYGLPEYELRPDGTLAMTLVRSVGYLGSPDPLSIVGGAGPNFPTPEGQCQGSHTFSFALIPHKGTYAEGEVWRRATEHHLPVCAVQQRRHQGHLPLNGSFLRLRQAGAALQLSAVKKAWDRSSIVIRIFNPTDSAVHASLWWWQPIREAYHLDLQECRLEPATIDCDHEIALFARPKKIITLELVSR